MCKRKVFFDFFVILILSLVFSEIVTAAEDSRLARSVTGVYSDMCYNVGGADIVGMEVQVVYSQKGYYVVYQSSEGEPSVPVVIQATIKNKTVEFDIPEGVPFSGNFNGQITDKGIEGKIEGYSGYASKLILKRQLSYWQRLPEENVCHKKR
jgi:hypothetical protein